MRGRPWALGQQDPPCLAPGRRHEGCRPCAGETGARESVTGFCPPGSCSPASLLDTSVYTCVCASVENESPGPLQAHSRSLSSPNHGHRSCCSSPEELPETRLGASSGAVAPSPLGPAPAESPARTEGQCACQPRPRPCPRLTSPPASDTRAGWAAPQSGCETAPWGQAAGSEGNRPPGTWPGTLRTLPGSFGTPLLTAGAGRAASSTGGLGDAGRARGRGAGTEGVLRLPARPTWYTSWWRLSSGADAFGDPLATRHPTEAQEGMGPPKTHCLLVAGWTPSQARGGGEHPGPAGLPARDKTEAPPQSQEGADSGNILEPLRRDLRPAGCLPPS